MFARASLLALATMAVALALPTEVESRATIPLVPAATIAGYKPYTYYASAAYCSPSTTINWSCGANCQKNPGFAPIASGGDGGSVQFWYVGYDPTLKTIVVAHQGTDFSKLEAALTDANVPLESFDPALFPGVSSSVQVHDGFKDEQAKTASSILSAVQTGMSKYGATHVTIVGHSLGGALSLIDSVYLPLHLPSTTVFRTITYGMPRVGNQAFANYVDGNSRIHLTHINNKKDIVPIIPGRFLGYHHPSGENHINADLTWSACPGQDNTSTQCSVGDTPNIFEGDTDDHTGPYDGVNMGC